MMATVQAVSPLAVIDRRGRKLSNADGTPAVRHPDAVGIRLRWRITGEANYRSCTEFSVREATAARRAHVELERARRDGTEVGEDG